MDVLTIAVILVALVVALRVYNRLTLGRCRCTARLDGKVVVVTGANTGLGKETALALAARGARVILACRDLKKAEQARDDIVAATGNRDVLVHHLDLLSLASVRAFAKSVLQTESRLDVLVNNAGAGGLPHEFTVDGLSMGMQVNHFGPFLLTCLLLGLLQKTPGSRIIMVSSMAHPYGYFDIDNLNCEKSYNGLYQYANSKLCNVLTAQYIAQKTKRVAANSLHPGVVQTDIFRNIKTAWIRNAVLSAVGFLCKSAEEGAQTIIHLALSEEGGRVSGKYFTDLKMVKAGGPNSPGLAERVWKRSEEYVKLADHERPFRD